MILKTILLPLLFPFALLGAAAALIWYALQGGWYVVNNWLDDQVEELP